MTVEVLFFASMADAVGRTRETVELDEGTTVSGLWRALVERYPGLGGLAYRPLVACDMDYSSWERELAGVREVAFLPPVSGG